MSAFHYFAGERLSMPELMAACLDGDLIGIGDGYMPADAAETAWMRARSLGPLLGDSLAATHATAAWIHGALSEPPWPIDVQRSSERRGSSMPDNRLIYRDLRIEPIDVIEIAGVRVSTPARTVADLARAGSRYETAFRAMLASDPHLATSGLAWLNARSRLPGIRNARQMLASQIPQTQVASS